MHQKGFKEILPKEPTCGLLGSVLGLKGPLWVCLSHGSVKGAYFLGWARCSVRTLYIFSLIPPSFMNCSCCFAIKRRSRYLH